MSTNLRDDVNDEEFQKVTRLIYDIDKDPEHTLPEGIQAIIKNAAWHRTEKQNYVSGFIWYDRNKRFVDDYPINTSEVISRENGVITTKGGHKYLAQIITNYRS